eukprot:PhM_4_TR10211/c3_g1_i1/m.92942
MIISLATRLRHISKCQKLQHQQQQQRYCLISGFVSLVELRRRSSTSLCFFPSSQLDKNNNNNNSNDRCYCSYRRKTTWSIDHAISKSLRYFTQFEQMDEIEIFAHVMVNDLISSTCVNERNIKVMLSPTAFQTVSKRNGNNNNNNYTLCLLLLKCVALYFETWNAKLLSDVVSFVKTSLPVITSDGPVHLLPCLFLFMTRLSPSTATTESEKERQRLREEVMMMMTMNCCCCLSEIEHFVEWVFNYFFREVFLQGKHGAQSVIAFRMIDTCNIIASVLFNSTQPDLALKKCSNIARDLTQIFCLTSLLVSTKLINKISNSKKLSQWIEKVMPQAIDDVDSSLLPSIRHVLGCHGFRVLRGHVLTMGWSTQALVRILNYFNGDRISTAVLSPCQREELIEQLTPTGRQDLINYVCVKTKTPAPSARSSRFHQFVHLPHSSPQSVCSQYNITLGHMESIALSCLRLTSASNTEKKKKALQRAIDSFLLMKLSMWNLPRHVADEIYWHRHVLVRDLTRISYIALALATPKARAHFLIEEEKEEEEKIRQHLEETSHRLLNVLSSNLLDWTKLPIIELPTIRLWSNRNITFNVSTQVVLGCYVAGLVRLTVAKKGKNIRSARAAEVLCALLETHRSRVMTYASPNMVKTASMILIEKVVTASPDPLFLPSMIYRRYGRETLLAQRLTLLCTAVRLFRFSHFREKKCDDKSSSVVVWSYVESLARSCAVFRFENDDVLKTSDRAGPHICAMVYVLNTLTRHFSKNVSLLLIFLTELPRRFRCYLRIIMGRPFKRWKMSLFRSWEECRRNDARTTISTCRWLLTVAICLSNENETNDDDDDDEYDDLAEIIHLLWLSRHQFCEVNVGILELILFSMSYLGIVCPQLSECLQLELKKAYVRKKRV